MIGFKVVSCETRRRGANNTMTIKQMIEAILDELNIINKGVIKAEQFDGSKNEDLKEIYEFVMMRDPLSLAEVDAIVDEL
jgi:uncharacterized protein YfkK (UPF0435 family)